MYLVINFCQGFDLRPPNVEHCIPRRRCRSLDGVPAALEVAEVFLHLLRARRQRAGKSILCSASGFLLPPLFGQCSDVLVGALREVIDSLIELERCVEWVVFESRKSGCCVSYGCTCHTLPVQRDLGIAFELVRAYVGATRHLSQTGSCCTLRVYPVCNLAGHTGHLPRCGSCRIAGGNQSVAIRLRFAAALIPGCAQRSHSSAGQRKRIDHAHHVAAHSLECGRDPAKRILELAALLDQYGQGRRPAGQRRHHVRHLHGDGAQRLRHLFDRQLGGLDAALQLFGRLCGCLGAGRERIQFSGGARNLGGRRFGVHVDLDSDLMHRAHF